MDPLSIIEQWWWAGPAAAAVVGVALGASPLAWPILLTAVGAGAGSADSPKARPTHVVLGIGAGITLVYAALGLVADQLERVIREVLGAWAGPVGLAVAVLAAVLGGLLLWRPQTTCRRLARPRAGTASAVPLGVLLGTVSCPACAGVITGVAASASALGSTVYTVGAMAALGAGHTLALLLVSRLSLGLAGHGRDPRLLPRLGGGMLLLAGAVLAVQATQTGVDVGPTLP